jgi:4-hydroxyphenylacetate 3-monooxygenase
VFHPDRQDEKEMPMSDGKNGVGMRTGKQFLDDLARSERAIFIEGERVSNPVEHPAFRGGAHSISRLFDLAAAPENRGAMTFLSPATGNPVWRCYQIPKSHADLSAKRIAAEKWAELTFGLMGRTPDHVSNFFCGFAAKPSVFAAAGKNYADNVVKFHEYLRDNHLYVAYAIVPPQIDRGKPAHQQSDPTLYAGVVKETDSGIVITGGQQLASGGIYADWLHVSCIHPLQPGDENYAFSLAVPMDAPGIKLYPRRAYPLGVPSMQDYPLTSRFDETDSFVVFDNVHVPWEQVFAYRNIELCRDQWWKTPSHLYGNLQAQARYGTKLRFLAGIAKRINEAIGTDASPPHRIALGELTAFASIVEGMIRAQEVMAEFDDEGVLWPSKTALYSVMSLQSEINPRVFEIVREMTGSAMITVPSSSKDLENPDAASDIDRYYQSASLPARERIELMRLAWDFIGSEFANRHHQYEKFYGGASAAVKMNMFRSYDFARAGGLVDDALALSKSAI